MFVSLVWLLTLGIIMLWSVWIALQDKFSPPIVAEVKKANEYQVSRFRLRHFEANNMGYQLIVAESLYFDPIKKSFFLQQVAGDGFLPSTTNPSSFKLNGDDLLVIPAKENLFIDMKQPRLYQQFNSGKETSLVADRGVYDKKVLTASGNVVLVEGKSRVVSQELKYDFQSGEVDLQGGRKQRVVMEF
jgi:hypothetical protein